MWLFALELAGFNHYVPMGKPVLMIGHPKQDKVPDWMIKADSEYELKFFSTKIFPRPQLTTFNKGDSKRLFLYMAQKAGHDWFDRLDRSKIELVNPA